MILNVMRVQTAQGPQQCLHHSFGDDVNDRKVWMMEDVLVRQKTWKTAVNYDLCTSAVVLVEVDLLAWEQVVHWVEVVCQAVDDEGKDHQDTGVGVPGVS